MKKLGKVLIVAGLVLVLFAAPELKVTETASDIQEVTPAPLADPGGGGRPTP